MNILICVITYKRSELFKKCITQNYKFLEEIGFNPTIISVHNDQCKEDASFIDNSLRGISLIPKNNLGVAGGRNLILNEIRRRKLTDSCAIFIDDDAVLKNFSRDVLEFQDFSIIACQSVDSKLEIRKYELPYGINDISKFKKVANFVGVAHIFMPDILRSNLVYDSRFMYGFEEMYFSLLALSKDFDIAYNPLFQVLHYKSSEGRLAHTLIILERLKNKFIIANTFFCEPIKTIYKLTNLLLCLLRKPITLFHFFSINASSNKILHKLNKKEKLKLLNLLKVLNFPLWR
jgi:GT2 family glycosyltransferase